MTEENSDNKEIEKADDSVVEEGEEGLPTYVSNITSIEQQVGTHVIRALQHDGAVGVLTVVQSGGSGGAPGGQRILSVPLDDEMFAEIQQLVTDTQEEQKREVQCFGFHCARELPDDSENK